MNDFKILLNDDGKRVLLDLTAHVSKIGIEDIDEYGLVLLADAFAIYSQNAKFCNENGYVYEMPTKTGTYPMVRPEYTVMLKAADYISKNAGKFGLTPGDRARIFNMKEKGKKEKVGFDLGDKPMKIAK